MNFYNNEQHGPDVGQQQLGMDYGEEDEQTNGQNDWAMKRGIFSDPLHSPPDAVVERRGIVNGQISHQ